MSEPKSSSETKLNPDQKSIEPLTRPPLLHVSVQESLRKYIQSNQLKAGDPLPPETFLAQRLGVGRNSVREAIKALEFDRHSGDASGHWRVRQGILVQALAG